MPSWRSGRVFMNHEKVIIKFPCRVTLGLFLFSHLLAYADQEPIGKCGTMYTTPQDLIWLTNNVVDCTDGVPCEHTILAPSGYVVRLNFTRLSGLEYSELSSNSNSYDLIDGQSNCQPRIEVTETYAQGEYDQITRRKTLCYDRIFGSSVVIHTRSRKVILSIFCLARKYSFFAMNFSFVPKPDDCSLECHGMCLQVKQLCDNVNDCPYGEDEQNCDSLIKSHSDEFSTKQDYDDFSHSSMVIGVVLAASTVILVVIVTICIKFFQRKHISQQLTTDNDDEPNEIWDESQALASSSLRQELLQSKQQTQSQRNTAQHSANSSRTRDTDFQSSSSSATSYEMPQYPHKVKNSLDGEAGYLYNVAELRNTRLWERHVKLDVTAPPNKYPFDNNSRHSHYLISSNSDINEQEEGPPPYSPGPRRPFHTNCTTSPPSYDVSQRTNRSQYPLVNDTTDYHKARLVKPSDGYK